jgi:hypothetical protein
MGTLAFTAGLVFFGHWLDFYQMIKPGVWYNYEHQMHISHAGHGHDNHGHDAEGHEGHGHGTDGNHDNHSHEGHGDAHSDATYHLQDGDLETPRAVLTAGGGHAAEAGAGDHGDHGHAEAGGIVMGVHIPGFLELGTMLGFLGLFLFVTFTSLGRASLYPKNDPYLLESEHHDTGVGVVKDIH